MNKCIYAGLIFATASTVGLGMCNSAAYADDDSAKKSGGVAVSDSNDTNEDDSKDPATQLENSIARKNAMKKPGKNGKRLAISLTNRDAKLRDSACSSTIHATASTNSDWNCS